VVDLECPRRAIRQKCSSRNDCISANCVTVDYMGLTRICLPCGALYACERGNNLSPCHWIVTIPAHAMTCAECPLLILFPIWRRHGSQLGFMLAIIVVHAMHPSCRVNARRT
jgi:hypothetical protein